MTSDFFAFLSFFNESVNRAYAVPGPGILAYPGKTRIDPSNFASILSGVSPVPEGYPSENPLREPFFWEKLSENARTFEGTIELRGVFRILSGRYDPSCYFAHRVMEDEPKKSAYRSSVPDVFEFSPPEYVYSLVLADGRTTSEILFAEKLSPCFCPSRFSPDPLEAEEGEEERDALAYGRLLKTLASGSSDMRSGFSEKALESVRATTSRGLKEKKTANHIANSISSFLLFSAENGTLEAARSVVDEETAEKIRVLERANLSVPRSSFDFKSWKRGSSILTYDLLFGDI